MEQKSLKPKSGAAFIAPSILAADFGRLADDIGSVTEGGADWIHIDVMDGSFVPPITFGDNVVSLARRITPLFLDVHLMIEKPELHLETFAKAGAHRIIVHREVCPHLYRTLTATRALGVLNGVAINPGTPAESIFDVLEVCDLVLVMTVNPGWGGQPFLPGMLAKISAVRAEIERRKLPTLIEVDGGINAETGKRCFEAGARVFVAGSSVFGATDRAAAISALRV